MSSLRRVTCVKEKDELLEPQLREIGEPKERKACNHDSVDLPEPPGEWISEVESDDELL